MFQDTVYFIDTMYLCTAVYGKCFCCSTSSGRNIATLVSSSDNKSIEQKGENYTQIQEETQRWETKKQLSVIKDTRLLKSCVCI